MHKYVSWLLFLLCFPIICAAQLDIAIPEPLQPWKPWVLYQQKDIHCVTPFNNSQQSVCLWPGAIKLDLSDTQATFSLNIKTDKEGFVALPGSASLWPLAVMINGKSQAVILKNNTPHVYLMPGDYLVSGQINYDRRPDVLPIPTDIVAISLSINNKPVENTHRESDGRLWLTEKNVASSEQNQQDTISIQVFRLFQDGIPMESTTVLKLKVTGQIREADLGDVLMDGQSALDVQSALPARLDEEGHLRLQVKPGSWEAQVRARFKNPMTELVFKPESNWPKEEIWSFQNQSDMRLVDIQGGQSIDPTQTAIPSEWQQFPTYLMKPDQGLTLTEKRRGQEKSRYEDLTLTREMWLDFSGKQFTVVDNMQGNIESSWRLNMSPPLELGRVSIDGRDRLITVLEQDKMPGVEVRQGSLNMLAVSKMSAEKRTLPAIGWNLDVKSLSARLYLPPGWLLIDVAGADSVTKAWLRQWTLFDFFLVLIIAASAWKLLGMGWGVLMGVMLTLVFHEFNAPTYSWLNVLAALALYLILPLGRAKTTMSYYLKLSYVLLVIFALPFMAQQIQHAIYPQLETPRASMGMSRSVGSAMEMAAAPIQKSRAMMSEDASLMSKAQPQAIEDYDPNAKVQTGPGIPQWHWRDAEIYWTGPVLKDQTMTIYMIPSWANSILKVLQAFMIAWLLYGLIIAWRKGIHHDGDQANPAKPIHPATAMIALALIASAMIPQSSFADYPDQKLLQDLKARLLEPHGCYPDCANIDQLQIEAQGDVLTLRLHAGAVIRTAIPVPNGSFRWLPQTLLIDGAKSTAMRLDKQQQLWIQLEPGQHEVVLQGSLIGLNELDLSVPLKPNWITSQLKDWEVQGLVNHQVPGQSIQLKRSQSTSQSALPANWQQSVIPTFVELNRTFKLGLDWEVVNQVQRIAPMNKAIQISVPLVEGEQVLSSDVEVRDGFVYVAMGPNQSTVTWHSKLNKVSKINLKAVNQNSIKENWYLDASSEWHCDFEGIPMVHQRSQTGRWFPSWQPWPDETLTINIIRPEALAGKTLSIDSTQHVITPGKRATDHQLSATIRSSQGAVHTIKLPNDVVVQDVRMDGMSQPINFNQGDLAVPIRPGQQQLDIKWQSNLGIEPLFKTQTIDMNSSSSNNILNLALNNQRWILMLGGPLMGPAVLFWGILIVVLFAAIVLGRVMPTPLKAWQWFLLGIGLTVASPMAAIVCVAWFFAIYQRGKASGLKPEWFNAIQVLLVMLTVAFVVSLFTSVSNGLLGVPQMQIHNPQYGLAYMNQMYNQVSMLTWYQDVSATTLPTSWVVSLPMYVYRVFMLLWALWLAFSLINWLRWGWQNFAKNGMWQRT